MTAATPQADHHRPGPYASRTVRLVDKEGPETGLAIGPRRGKGSRQT